MTGSLSVVAAVGVVGYVFVVTRLIAAGLGRLDRSAAAVDRMATGARTGAIFAAFVLAWGAQNYFEAWRLVAPLTESLLVAATVSAFYLTATGLASIVVIDRALGALAPSVRVGDVSVPTRFRWIRRIALVSVLFGTAVLDYAIGYDVVPVSGRWRPAVLLLGTTVYLVIVTPLLTRSRFRLRDPTPDERARIEAALQKTEFSPAWIVVRAREDLGGVRAASRGRFSSLVVPESVLADCDDETLVVAIAQAAGRTRYHASRVSRVLRYLPSLGLYWLLAWAVLPADLAAPTSFLYLGLATPAVLVGLVYVSRRGVFRTDRAVAGQFGGATVREAYRGAPDAVTQLTVDADGDGAELLRRITPEPSVTQRLARLPGGAD